MHNEKTVAFLKGLRVDGDAVMLDGEQVCFVMGHTSRQLSTDDVALALVSAAHTAASLVHCADCKFWMRVTRDEGDCTAHRRAIVSRRDCYCSWGEGEDA